MKRILVCTFIFCSSTLISMEWPGFPKRRFVMSAAGTLALQYYEDESRIAYTEREGELRNAWFDIKTESYGGSVVTPEGRVALSLNERSCQIYKALESKFNSLR